MEQLIHGFLVPGDASLIGHTGRAFQRSASCFVEAAHLFGRDVSLKSSSSVHEDQNTILPISPLMALN